MSDTVEPKCPLSMNGTWRTYTTADGLAGLKTEHIAEDSEGYLWIATVSSGVSRFDGDIFHTFTMQDGLCGNQVYAIHLDRQGRLWFGTFDGGVCWYDGRAFHRFDEDDGVSNGSITHIFEDQQGRLWFGGPDTIGYYDSTGFGNLYSIFVRDCGKKKGLGECFGITQDEEGYIWFGFLHLLLRYDGSVFCALTKKEGLPQQDISNNYAVARDGDSGLWVGNRKNIWRYDGKGFQSIEVDLSSSLSVRKIQPDRQGRTWFCTAGDGAYCFDGVQFHHILNPLAHPSVNAVLEDREGHLWFATWGGGISCYDPHSICLINEQQGLPKKTVTSLLEDRRGDIWMGFYMFADHPSNKVARYDGASLTILNLEQGLNNEGDCRTLYEDRNGHLWVGSWADWKGGQSRLYRYDGQAFQDMGAEQGSSGNYVTAIGGNREGLIYLGCMEDEAWDKMQIVSYDERQFRSVCSFEYSSSSCITAIIETREHGLLFAVGTRTGHGSGQGIGRFSKDKGITFYTVADGLQNNQVNDLLEDAQGSLWIATAGGLSRFDGEHFQNFTTEHGLPNDHVQCLCEDRQGHLWIGTEGGVVRYDRRLFQTVRSKYIGSVASIIEDRQGRLWFGTYDGVVCYTPMNVPPRIRLLQVVADQTYQDVEEIQLYTPTRQVTFEYKGLSFRTHPRDMLYIYRLEGYEDEWQSPTREMRAFYRDLPPGEYTFQVKAIDRDLNESEEPATVRVTVILDPHLEALTATLSQSADEFIGQSAGLRQLQQQLAAVAPTDLTVLILGETGTGKGLAARTLHHLSARTTASFILVNCGAIPENLVESELFGHEQGAFTGAVRRQLGKVELAQGGTFFLDEIGDMPLGIQVKLLRLLEERVFERVGGRETLPADARLVAATNRDLEQMMAEKTFREDLYFRLQTFPVQLPPLRQRREDIPVLTDHFAKRFAHHLNRPIPEISPAARTWLQAYDWPGNVRELEHVIQRAVLLCRNNCIEAEDVAPAQKGEERTQEEAAFLSLAEQEKRYIERALEATGGVIYGEKGAAQLLHLNPNTLRSKMRKHGIRRPD